VHGKYDLDLLKSSILGGCARKASTDWLCQNLFAAVKSIHAW
jgi:hypothetical protein